MNNTTLTSGFQEMAAFGLMESLLGRRSRRFFMGAEVPDGVFRNKSKHEPLPLSELEKKKMVESWIVEEKE